MELPAREELCALDKLPELAGSGWPYRGHRDFRKFTQDDYDNFAAGVFQNTQDARKCQWFGGRARFDAALAKLKELGYEVTAEQPTGKEDGARWWRIRFAPKTIPADYVPDEIMKVGVE